MRVSILGAAIALAACATPYRPPSEPAPALWSGAAGMRQTATRPVPVDPVAVGGVLLESEFEVVRTGRIREAMTYKGAYGEDEVVAADTPVIAQQFALMSTTRYGYAAIGPTRNLNAENNPIEWCTADPAQEPICIFWEGPSEARCIKVARPVLRMHVPFMESGMPCPMPNIVEEPIDFGGPLRRQLILADLNSEGARIITQIVDGGSIARMGGERELRWFAGGSHTGGPYGDIWIRLRPQPDATAPQTVTIEVSSSSDFLR